MEDIKLVLVDIDGTLLNSEEIVTEKTKKTIAKLADHHILFGIATGRTPYAVKNLVKYWGIDEYVDIIMGFNGGCYFNMHNNEMKSFYLMDGKYIPQVFEDFKDFDFNPGIFDKESFHALYDDDRSRMIAGHNQLELIIDDLTSYHHKDIEKILMIAEPDVVTEMVKHYATLDVKYKGVRTSPKLFEIFNPALSKSKGIEELCKDLGIPTSSVLTFGDASNDYEMIRDYIGVAMGNAYDEIKEVAKYITKSNDEDGIAYFLEEYVLK